MRKEKSEAVRTITKIMLKEEEVKGRSKKKYLNVIESDTRMASLCVNDAGDLIK